MAEYVQAERSVENTRWQPLHQVEKSGKWDNRWLMRCACGTEKIVDWRNYRSGKSLSCGCYRKELSALAPGESARNLLILIYKGSASKKGRTYTLSVEEFTELTSANCHYCGEPPFSVVDRTKWGTNGVYVYNGIDRKDPSVGYELENCVTACQKCNYAKRTMSYEEFLSWIRTITNYQTRLETGLER